MSTVSPNTSIAAAEVIRRAHAAGGPDHDDGDACETLAARLTGEQTDPLDMARNAAAAVLRYAELDTEAADDPMRQLDLYMARIGERQHSAARLAGQMALVSLAGDVRRLADLFTQEAWFIGRPAESGPIVDTPEG